MAEETDIDEMLQALDAAPEEKKAENRSPRETRIIAGFEDILKFIDDHGHPPEHGEDRNIFERTYAVRLDALRQQPDAVSLLREMDATGLLNLTKNESLPEDIDVDELLALLDEAADPTGVDIENLQHVRSRATVRAADEIANRKRCDDFEKFAPLFDQVQMDLDEGSRETRRFMQSANIGVGEFYILNGQKAYVANIGKRFKNEYDRYDSRLRVIYDNGTENDILLRSFQRGLYKDDAGRRITDPNAGPLFGSTSGEEDLETGTIYVLRSLSLHPDIAKNRQLIHKIGVTGGNVEKRISNAAQEATYLLADVEIAAEYKLYNVDRSRLENILHRVFAVARLDIQIPDRFGNYVKPREWFLAPLEAIDEAVNLIQSGEIENMQYDVELAAFVPR